MFSISIGEEDRKNLTDIMRAVLWRYVPLMSAITLLIIVLADPLTRLYYRDATTSVYQMTLWGFRILPLAMPFSVFTQNYTCYVQAAGKLRLTHFFSFLNGVALVITGSAILIPWFGMNGVYAAHALNSPLLALVMVLYACWYQKGRLRSLDDLMAFPSNFGVVDDEWMHLEVHDMDQVTRVSAALQSFCLQKGIDQRRAFFAALAMEEMAGNIVLHGKKKNRSQNDIDIRVTHKDNDLILRIKDDYLPFNPVERLDMLTPEDKVSNIGIYMVYQIATDMQYQSILGLNALTIRI